MAYRRKQGMSRSSTFKEENIELPSPPPPVSTSTASSSPSYYSNSLAAQALRASSASRNIDSPVLSHLEPPRSKGFNAYEDTRNNSKGFWGVLARKAKAIIDEEDVSKEFERPNRAGSSYMMDASTASPRKHQQQQQQQQQTDGYGRMDNPTIRKGLDRLNTSLNQIGDSFEKAFEEGRTIMESRTQDIIQETRKLQIRRKGNSPMAQNHINDFNSTLQSPRQQQNQTNHETQVTQLKASRDVAMATAAKAKLLLRELKTVKADLAFAKERCAQLEDENKLLRESLDKGDNPEDDDLIRLQLETLLAEKGRLAHENSVYARENRFLREVVEYHQMSMQDVVYLDEGTEEVTPVLYPISLHFSKMLSDASPPKVEVETEATPPKVEVEVETEATPSSSTNHPRSPSPSPGPGPSQQAIPTEEASPHITQPTEEISPHVTQPTEEVS